MAGGGGDEDNPVPINVIPLVDIIFCLCIFFMCSFRFKQLEGSFDTWLPRDKGTGQQPVGSEVIEEIRIALFWNDTQAKTEIKLGHRRIDDLTELEQLVIEGRADFLRKGRDKAPVTIDSDAFVPWKVVNDIVNICKRNQINEVEFAMGTPPPVK